MTNKSELYQELRAQLTSLLKGEPDAIANAANTAALLYHSMPDVNWVGFYFLKGSDLVLGPFQGRPACVRIPLGKGVCGTAGERRVSMSTRFPDTSRVILRRCRSWWRHSLGVARSWAFLIWIARCSDASTKPTAPGARAWLKFIWNL